MMADHQHVQMLVHGVDGVRPGRVGGGRQYIVFATGFDDVRGVTTAGPFGVVSVNGTAFERGEGVFDKTGFVQRVGVDGDLHIVVVGDGQAAINRGGGGSPVFMQFQAHCASFDLFDQGFRQAGVAFAEQANVHRQSVHGLQHAVQVPWARCASGGIGSGGRA